MHHVGKRSEVDLRRLIRGGTARAVDKDDQSHESRRNEHEVVEASESEVESHSLSHVGANERQRLKFVPTTHRCPVLL